MTINLRQHELMESIQKRINYSSAEIEALKKSFKKQINYPSDKKEDYYYNLDILNELK